MTSKRELENYLHVSVLMVEAHGYVGNGSDFENVPMLFAEAIHSADPTAPTWATLSPERKKEKASAAKKKLNTICAERMTPELVTQSDPHDEVRTWLRSIGQALNS